jgi:hypothetical protein
VPHRLGNLIPNPGVVFEDGSVGQNPPRLGAADLAERPGGVAADERVGIVERAGQGRNGGRIAQVAQGNADVAEEAGAAGSFEGRVRESLVERVLGQG